MACQVAHPQPCTQNECPSGSHPKAPDVLKPGVSSPLWGLGIRSENPRVPQITVHVRLSKGRLGSILDVSPVHRSAQEAAASFLQTPRLGMQIIMHSRGVGCFVNRPRDVAYPVDLTPENGSHSLHVPTLSPLSLGQDI